MAEVASEAAALNLQTAPMEAAYMAMEMESRKGKRKASEARIIWPPVVIIENTLTHFDPVQKMWKGLENEEIRTFMKGVKDIDFGRVMALYNKAGNRGKSVVIFPSTPSGFFDAQTVCELLEREKRGRRHWLELERAVRDPCGPGRFDAEGKKILFGYLANKADMDANDRERKFVKRWSEESLVEKVIQPLNWIERDKKEAIKKRAKLTEQAKQIELSVEHNRAESGKAAAEFKKINAEIHLQKMQEEELEAKHKKAFEERTAQYKKEKLRKLAAFEEREKHIRDRLQQNNIEKQNAVSQYEELARRLKDGIHMEKKKHELRSTEQQQMEVLEHMKIDSLLQSQMEEKLALLEKRFQDKQLELQQQQNKQIMKLRAEFTEEKEKFLQEKLKELKGLEKESQEAKTITTETQKQIEGECIICLMDIAVEKLERALFVACGHANICSNCVLAFWESAKRKKVTPRCPTCNAEQPNMYTLIPAVIYS